MANALLTKCKGRTLRHNTRKSYNRYVNMLNKFSNRPSKMLIRSLKSAGLKITNLVVVFLRTNMC